MYPGSVTRAGDKGATVKIIQERLKAIGVRSADNKELAIDSDFGPSTESAVKLFQARSTDADGQPLDVDGAVGPMTWAALFSTLVTPAPAPEDTYIDKVIDVALSQVGVLEDPIGSNRGPQVDIYLKSVGLNPKDGHYAWCAAFVFWCFKEAAEKLGKTNPAPKSAGVHEMWHLAGNAKRLRYTPKQATAAPELIKPGQLFFLDTGSGNGHVGLITGVTGVHLTTIEGNTTNISGSREGIGVFKRSARSIPQINLGFADFTRPA